MVQERAGHEGERGSTAAQLTALTEQVGLPEGYNTLVKPLVHPFLRAKNPLGYPSLAIALMVYVGPTKGSRVIFKLLIN